MDAPRYHYYTRGYKTACGAMNPRAFVGNDEVDCPRCLYRMNLDRVVLTEKQRDTLNAYLKDIQR